ncbi:MAG: hypothetical protein JWP81_4504 [Ferruginibacter sp.]|nr:hypothetical protein [Ferruginibacter sp.]
MKSLLPARDNVTRVEVISLHTYETYTTKETKSCVRFFMSQAEVLLFSFSGVALLYFLSLWTELKSHEFTPCEV